MISCLLLQYKWVAGSGVTRLLPPTARLPAIGLEACGFQVCKGSVQSSTGAGLARAAWAADGPNCAHCIYADVGEAQEHIALLATALHMKLCLENI